tara:strand:- start:3958 stop:4287 length:330 start_codon:yes stop_codon:yes gene_type:complete
MKINLKLICISLFVLFLITGCSNREAYIYDPHEFNRERADFGRELTDRTEVSICYHMGSTTPQMLEQMADDECRKFNKKAKFKKNQILICSVSTPALIHFDCINSSIKN